jgi:hypothetical protein
VNAVIAGTCTDTERIPAVCGPAAIAGNIESGRESSEEKKE